MLTELSKHKQWENEHLMDTLQDKAEGQNVITSHLGPFITAVFIKFLFIYLFLRQSRGKLVLSAIHLSGLMSVYVCWVMAVIAVYFKPYYDVKARETLKPKMTYCHCW